MAEVILEDVKGRQILVLAASGVEQKERLIWFRRKVSEWMAVLAHDERTIDGKLADAL
jgi:hypothetical protein